MFRELIFITEGEETQTDLTLLPSKYVSIIYCHITASQTILGRILISHFRELILFVCLKFVWKFTYFTKAAAI